MNVINVAKYIINMCINEDSPISNLQLQKMLYFTYKNMLKSGIKLFNAEFEARDYGPVCREVYDEFIAYGATKLSTKKETTEPLRREISDIIDKVIKENLNKSPWKIVEESKNEQAWKNAYKKGERNIMKDEDIKAF